MCNLAENYILTGVPWRGQESVDCAERSNWPEGGVTTRGPPKPGEGWCRVEWGEGAGAMRQRARRHILPESEEVPAVALGASV